MTSTESRRAGWLLAAAALLAAGCHVPISQQISYKDKDGGEVPASVEPPPRAPKKNDLIVGIRRFEPTPSTREAIAEAGDPRELGQPNELGQRFAEELLAARVFKEVHYPYEEQAVDVILDATVDLELARNHGTNFVKVLPGLLALLPWIDAVGLGYDHAIGLDLKVRTIREPKVVCDTFKGRAELTVKRYPSILFGLGIHAGFFVLSALELGATDVAVAEGLAERNASQVNRQAIQWLTREFASAARRCSEHADLDPGPAAKVCPVCGKSLLYPILNRVDGKPPAPPPAPAKKPS